MAEVLLHSDEHGFTTPPGSSPVHPQSLPACSYTHTLTQSAYGRSKPTCGSMPNSSTSLRFVDTATMCLATASWPSSAVSHVLQ